MATKMIGLGYFKRFLEQKRDAAIREANEYNVMSEAWAIYSTRASVYGEVLSKLPEFFEED